VSASNRRLRERQQPKARQHTKASRGNTPAMGPRIATTGSKKEKRACAGGRQGEKGGEGFKSTPKEGNRDDNGNDTSWTEMTLLE